MYNTLVLQVLMDACEADQDSGLRLVVRSAGSLVIQPVNYGCDYLCILQASAQARDMALGIYDQHILHPLNDEMVHTN